MPARVLSPLVASDRIFRPNSGRYSHAPPRSREYRDEFVVTETIQGSNVPYDVSSRSHRHVLEHSSLSPPHHAFSLPYSVHRIGPTQVYVPPGFVVLHASPPGHAHSSPHGWLPHPPPAPRSPVVPPPPLPQKVWILDCNSCGTFLTNRGMKAVLLLCPSIPLYSTDALPANCSANGLASEPPKQHPHGHEQQVPNRSCECLTQTLYCHGCGNPIGYMIVAPCHRCTTSTTVTNRTTNGHRFVFYSSEISSTERVHVPGEVGVAMFHPPPVLPPPSFAQNPALTDAHGHVRSPTDPRNGRPARASSISSELGLSNSGASFSSSSGRGSVDIGMDGRGTPLSPSPGSPGSDSRSRRSSVPSDVCLEPKPLKAGENVFWHHLLRSGEIPAVHDDSRARAPPRSDIPDKPDVQVPKKRKAQSNTRARRMFAAAR